jgi:hypothetical protein
MAQPQLPPSHKSFRMVWEPNDRKANCTCCQVAFWLLKRRHHCRLCGSVVCNKCSEDTAIAPGYKDPVRVCVRCRLPNVFFLVWHENRQYRHHGPISDECLARQRYAQIPKSSSKLLRRVSGEDVLRDCQWFNGWYRRLSRYVTTVTCLYLVRLRPFRGTPTRQSARITSPLALPPEHRTEDDRGAQTPEPPAVAHPSAAVERSQTAPPPATASAAGPAPSYGYSPDPPPFGLEHPDCPICYHPFARTEGRRPVLCGQCGSSFCCTCYRECRSRGCPTCRRPLPERPVPNVALLHSLPEV